MAIHFLVDPLLSNIEVSSSNKSLRNLSIEKNHNDVAALSVELEPILSRILSCEQQARDQVYERFEVLNCISKGC